MCLAETGVGCRWPQRVQLPQPRRFPQIPSLCPYLPSLYLSVDVGPRRPCTTNSCTQFSESDFRVDCENWNKHCMPCVDVDSVIRFRLRIRRRKGGGTVCLGEFVLLVGRFGANCAPCISCILHFVISAMIRRRTALLRTRIH